MSVGVMQGKQHSVMMVTSITGEREAQQLQGVINDIKPIRTVVFLVNLDFI